MKVILREHVEHLGDRGEIVSVATGYARNFLLPKKLALEATEGNLKTLEQRRKVWAEHDAQDLKEAEELAARLAQIELSSIKKAGDAGTLYGSVTNAEIAEMLATKGIELDRKRILLDEPIKAVGSYEIRIKVHPKVEGQIKLEVVAEEEAD
jgi:large subunit ribosomal protein L9